MAVVDLGTIEEDFLGLIIPCSSKVEWSNQVGGIRCEHPKVEGVYVPLPVEWKPTPDPMVNIGGTTYRPDLVRLFLEESPELEQRFSVPEFHQGCCAEAWVPVTVRAVSPDGRFGTLLAPFSGLLGLLTYNNSD